MFLSRDVWPPLLVASGGILLALFWPLTSALSSSEVVRARLTCALLTLVVCAVVALLRRGMRPWVAISIAFVAGAAGVAVLLVHFDAESSCVAEYEGRGLIIGREYTAEGASYVARNPGHTASDLLLDTGGRVEPLWTSRSITSCRVWVGWGGLLNVPLFALCVSSVLASRPARFRTRAVASGTVPSSSGVGAESAPVYDAFISYRRNPVDAERAKELVTALESRGLRVAIDFRDFRENEHIVSEMERCVKESRFVLCVVSRLYLTSGFTSEEAIISKTRDLIDRQRRIVPLVFERVELPMTLAALVGIDFTESASVDPIEKLVDLLSGSSPSPGIGVEPRADHH